MKMLQPLAIHHFGLATGHVVEPSRIRKQHLQPTYTAYAHAVIAGDSLAAVPVEGS